MKDYILEKTPFIRISIADKAEDNIFNFKFQTAEQTAWFSLINAKEPLKNLISFLENLCLGKAEISCLVSTGRFSQKMKCKEEGGGLVRFTITGCNWAEHIWDTEADKVYLIEKKTQDTKTEILLDALINKKELIYAFYCTIMDLDENIEAPKIKTDIIDKYLGYVKCTKKDIELSTKLMNPKTNIEEIRQLLEEGANPNAITDFEDFTTIFDEFLLDWHYKLEDAEEYDNCGVEDSWEPAQGPVNEADIAYVNLTKLLIQYGAKTISLFSAIYNYIREPYFVRMLLDNNFFFDGNTMCFVSLDEWTLGADPFSKYYKILEELFLEYRFSRSYHLQGDEKLEFKKK